MKHLIFVISISVSLAFAGASSHAQNSIDELDASIMKARSLITKLEAGGNLSAEQKGYIAKIREYIAATEAQKKNLLDENRSLKDEALSIKDRKRQLNEKLENTQRTGRGIDREIITTNDNLDKVCDAITNSIIKANDAGLDYFELENQYSRVIQNCIDRGHYSKPAVIQELQSLCEESEKLSQQLPKSAETPTSNICLKVLQK